LSLVVVKLARFGLRSDLDVLAARRWVAESAQEIGFTVLDRTRVVTAASELARNMVVYGRGGVMSVEIVRNGNRAGLRLTFEDQGPGIADIDRALEDGYSTGGGLGLGLPGARRLSNEFQLTSTEGVGTCVTIARWKT
jgi:serine/threonine-protein kinase RsbT